MNVDNPPIDVILETEAAAQLGEATLRGGGQLVVTGAPQRLRLRTALGELKTYRLADIGQIDAWKVDFWYTAAESVKAPRIPAEDGATYSSLSGLGRLGADGSGTIGGVSPCSSLQAEDFSVAIDAPDMCYPSLGPVYGSSSVPGSVAMLLHTIGTCAVKLSFPAANGGQGLSKSLSVTFEAKP
jgi:hypothetical protein